MLYFQMEFMSRFILLSPVKRLNTVFDVSKGGDKWWLVAPGSEREYRIGLRRGSATGYTRMSLYGPL